MKTRNINFFRAIILMMSLILMFATAGCLFSPDEGGDDGGGGDTGLPFPGNEDILMSNFQAIYTGMLIDDFRDMLHADYQTILLSATISDWDWAPGATFDRDDEIAIHENMFGGNSGTDHTGTNVDPLDNIVIDLFEQIGTWTLVPENETQFPGTKKALYKVKIYFNDNTGTHAFEVDQQVIFYAIGVPDGGRTRYLLAGQRGIENP